MRSIRLLCATLLLPTLLSAASTQEPRPNILWITSEDNGPHLGCYGDPVASTPVLDALAARGMRYERAWSNAPVCAPARTTIITGVYASSLGAEHMRSEVPLPEGMQLFPQYLREAGYYCTNNSKTDYNLRAPGSPWDVSSNRAHWRGRAEGQPFFAVFNFTQSHESQIRRRPHEALLDPAEVRVPAYHPDHPEVRRDWAQYHDKLSVIDERAGRVLAELEQDGLTQDTIVVYYGDHGSGMPRSKRWPYDSGLRVPMIVHVPERLMHLAPDEYEVGGVSERLVSFVDLAPTALSLAGIQPPAFHQGLAFAGAFEAPAPAFAFGFRGRMDERVDLTRSVTDGRYVYIRNYMPQRAQGAYLDYMFQTPTTRVWRELYDRGVLEGPGQRRFWEPKSSEELYRLASDPDEVHDLARESDAEVLQALGRLRAALREHQLAVRDLGFYPEAELHALVGERAPYDLAREQGAYPLERALAAAEEASGAADAARLVTMLGDEAVHVRSWAASGAARTRASEHTDALRSALGVALSDESACVRVLAAEALVHQGEGQERLDARALLIEHANVEVHGLYVAVLALNSLDAIGALLPEELEAIAALPRSADGVPGRLRNYVPRLVDRLASKQPPAMQRRVYRTVGEVELSLDLFRPAGTPPDAGWPAIVFFHGGGWSSGSTRQFHDQGAHLAQLGVYAISAQYRLTSVNDTTPYDCVIDGKAALRWVRAQADELHLDPARIGAGGGSAGGHVAAAVAALDGFDDAPDDPVSCRPDALVLFNPVFDNGPGEWGHAQVEERWEEFSPAHNLGESAPPTLVMLGTEDALIPVATGERYAARMAELGRECELVLYEGEAHGFFNRDRNPAAYDATMAATERFLEGLGWIRP